MSLSCNNNEWDGEGVAWYSPSNFSTLKTSKRKRCSSCKQLIDVGSECLEFQRFRAPKTYIEEKILGEDAEIELASWYMCEICGEQFLNLEQYGYCIDITDNMLDLLKEHRELHNIKIGNDNNGK